MRLIVVAGPTASGKTALALDLAKRIGAEIVGFDSVQLYREFDIGTAKPTKEELRLVPHHMIGVADAKAPWTAGEYARRARPVIATIWKRERIPLLAGGTGFYLRALLQGLSPAPAADEALRARLRGKPATQLHRLLRRLDPEASRRISIADRSKAIRALEVRLLTGKPLAKVWERRPEEAWPGARVLKLGLAPERAALYERINGRAAAMFSGPILDETRRLLRMYPQELRIWSSHGYKQACDILLRGVPAATALIEAQQEQRRYAKRQWTWFRADPGFTWLTGFGDESGVQQRAAELASEFIAQGEGRV